MSGNTRTAVACVASSPALGVVATSCRYAARGFLSSSGGPELDAEAVGLMLVQETTASRTGIIAIRRTSLNMIGRSIQKESLVTGSLSDPRRPSGTSSIGSRSAPWQLNFGPIPGEPARVPTTTAVLLRGPHVQSG